MNVSESGLAELYRNLGREVPEGLMVDSPAAAPRKEKYGRIKKEVDGTVFDSTLEAEAYVIIKLWKIARVIFGLDLQPEYVLQDGFRDSAGKWHRAVKYIPDFRFARIDNQHQIILVDVKGVKTQAFSIKEKLFRAKFPHLDLQIWDRGKVKGLSRC